MVALVKCLLAVVLVILLTSDNGRTMITRCQNVKEDRIKDVCDPNCPRTVVVVEKVIDPETIKKIEDELKTITNTQEEIEIIAANIQAIITNQTNRLAAQDETASPIIVIDTSNNSNCDEIYKQGLTEDGVYNITVSGRLMTVYCEMQENGYNWLVLQRRRDGSQDFFKGWQEYSTGFGNLSGEFWLGLENLHVITSSTSHSLRVDLEDWNGNTAYAEYSVFSIGSSSTNYRLTVGSHSGTAGDSLAYHNNRQFSTKDRDNDGVNSRNDAVRCHGAWWYYHTHHSNLNGRYSRGQLSDCSGVRWYRFLGSTSCNSMKKTEMKIRPN